MRGEDLRAHLEMLRQIAREYPNTDHGKRARRELDDLERDLRAPTAIDMGPVHV